MLLRPQTTISAAACEPEVIDVGNFLNRLGAKIHGLGTPVLTTNDNGLTFTGATLANPIPSGQLVQPPGSSQGLASQLGQNLTGNSPGGGGPQTVTSAPQSQT